MTTQPVEYPCPWPLAEDCLPDGWADIEAPKRERAVALASMTLHRLTGYRLSVCTTTLRPCSPARAYPGRYIRPEMYGEPFWLPGIANRPSGLNATDTICP